MPKKGNSLRSAPRSNGGRSEEYLRRGRVGLAGFVHLPLQAPAGAWWVLSGMGAVREVNESGNSGGRPQE